MTGKKSSKAKRPKKNSALNFLLYGILIAVLGCAVALSWYIFSKETERSKQLAAAVKKQAEEDRLAAENARSERLLKKGGSLALIKIASPLPNRHGITKK
jgi:hypothetical protein